MQSQEIEEEIQRVLDQFIGATLSNVDCDVEDGVLEVTLESKQADDQKLKFEIMAPWRVVDEEEIMTGSGAILMAEGAKGELEKILQQVKSLLEKKVLEEYQFDDLQLVLSEEIQIQHFSDYSSNNPEDYNIALHWIQGDETTHFLLGPGSVYMSGEN